ncbi:uncharacterized protein SOCEGT47_038690 [Sorangium cellulosum]|uniref:IstB-like ATP-binding domain-containing protein n=2 Tax=Sorangium cellulosum TaxID=56 RepID=A0A4P2Q2Y4_SORCE|nr:uncharacterized protein SOCEGT47_038690 [Sorangium cellulosum]
MRSAKSRFSEPFLARAVRLYELIDRTGLMRSDRSFSDWGQVFPHAACVVTLVDRLVHRAEVIEIEADSYRLKEAKELSASRIKQRRARKH